MTNVYGYITQRARGVYLANTQIDETGDEAWDAFSTLAAAKRWCAEQLGHDRLPWQEVRKPGHWPRWMAEVEDRQ